MKICIVGSGNEGTGLAGLLALEPDVQEVVLADISAERLERARRRVESLRPRSSTRLRCMRVNAEDSENVAAVADGSDVVFHAVSPAFNLSVMRACLKVNAHYCDLFAMCADVPDVPYDETIEAQKELDNSFKAAGIAGVPCIGISPGWTTLSAKHMFAGFDEIDRVVIRNVDWIDSDALLAPAPPKLLLQMWLGPPGPLFMEDGAFKPVDLLLSEEQYEFPPPVGRQGIFAQTLPLDSPILNRYGGKSIRRIDERGAILSGGLGAKDIWLKAIQQQTSRETGTDDFFGLFGKSYEETAGTDFAEAYRSGRIRDGAFASAVEVTGGQAGVRVRHTVTCVSTLEQTRHLIPWGNPGTFATVGGMVIELILMLGRHECKRPVWAG